MSGHTTVAHTVALHRSAPIDSAEPIEGIDAPLCDSRSRRFGTYTPLTLWVHATRLGRMTDSISPSTTTLARPHAMNLSIQPGDAVRIVGTDYVGTVLSRTSLHAQFRYDANGRVRNIAVANLEEV